MTCTDNSCYIWSIESSSFFIEDSYSVTLPDASERLVEYDRYVEQQKKHKSQASGSDISLVGYDAQTSGNSSL